MFFNENFYLENEEMGKEAEVTDAEIKEAEEAVSDEAEEAGVSEEDISSPEATDAMTAETMQEATEYYYCLREKMMNIEHVASLKAKDGLVSESAMLLESGWETFQQKMENFFKKLKALIKNLFNKFINFLQSLTVSVKDIRNANVKAAWEAFVKRTKGTKIKVNILNTTSMDMIKTSGIVNAMYSYLKKDVQELENAYKGLQETDKDGNKDFEVKLSRPKKLKDRVDLKKNAIDLYLKGAIDKSDSSNTVLTKKEVELTENVFTQSIEFVKKYYDTLLKVGKENKKNADDIIDGCIKAVKKDAENAGQKKYQSQVIAQMRWVGSAAAAIYNRHTSVLKQYYRQCLLVSRRVIGAQKAAEGKERWNEMTSESFNMNAYFNI